MKYRLTGEEMELLAMHRAKLDAKAGVDLAEGTTDDNGVDI